MAVQIPPGFAQAAWEMRYPGDPDPWYCTCGIDIDTYSGSMTSLANLLLNMWGNGPANSQHTSMMITGVTLKVGNDGAPTMAYSTGAAEPGSASQNMLPQNCALLVDKLSDTGGRRGRGRFYVPNSLEEGSVSDVGVINPGVVTGIQGVYDTFYGSFATNNIAPVILHTPSAPSVVNPTPVGTPTPITGFRVQPVISTQRDRLR